MLTEIQRNLAKMKDDEGIVVSKAELQVIYDRLTKLKLLEEKARLAGSSV